MDIQHNDFVGIYDGFFCEEFCDGLISYFEWAKANNRSFGRHEAESKKKDGSVVLNPGNFSEISFSYANASTFLKDFNTTFWDVCYKDYSSVYSTLSDYDTHTIFTYKIQKTDPSGGYHIWHCEDGQKAYSNRVGVYILYLNDVEEGGETEFLYLSRRITPKKGRLVIFPPNYPWSHRGNPPLTGTKYIMTGWVEFA